MSVRCEQAVQVLLTAGLLAFTLAGFEKPVLSQDTAPGAPASAQGRAPTTTPSPVSASPAAAAPSDPRPVIRLGVVSALRTEDKVFAQVMEGRLVTDLADMETFRTVASDHPGDLRLTCTIRALSIERLPR